MAYTNENADKAKDYIDNLEGELKDSIEEIEGLKEEIRDRENTIDGLNEDIDALKEEIVDIKSLLIEKEQQLKQTYQIC